MAPSPSRDSHAESSRSRGIGITFLSFVAVGGLATGVQFVTLVALVEALRLAPAIASSLGFGIAAVLNYWLNYHVTFQSRASHGRAGARFAVVAMVGFALNAGTMMVLETVAHWHYLWAQVLTTCLTLIWTFGASRLWAFRTIELDPTDESHAP